ncbi:hypothetical protein B0T26DRAFT_170765 [Lasiosphaeria miniovina]|uniref:Uncharacterized protein n=1 Tax=Lasiosphaeria miniovina TaxID=1954250 RepID=A0AA40B6F9_9PEZI|nr:uncharacterized protein B0T26DRAFT_170765 [Lasiosphaeria miniovina]KAK0728417.1 hypothetical protein B0T26DRAFT_170765 [Lasiosphaeria miniovina]
MRKTISADLQHSLPPDILGFPQYWLLGKEIREEARKTLPKQHRGFKDMVSKNEGSPSAGKFGVFAKNRRLGCELSRPVHTYNNGTLPLFNGHAMFHCLALVFASRNGVGARQKSAGLVLDVEEKGKKGAALLPLLTLRPPTKRGGTAGGFVGNFFPNGSPSKVGMDYGLDRRRCNSVAWEPRVSGPGKKGAICQRSLRESERCVCVYVVVRDIPGTLQTREPESPCFVIFVWQQSSV